MGYFHFALSFSTVFVICLNSFISVSLQLIPVKALYPVPPKCIISIQNRYNFLQINEGLASNITISGSSTEPTALVQKSDFFLKSLFPPARLSTS